MTGACGNPAIPRLKEELIACTLPNEAAAAKNIAPIVVNNCTRFYARTLPQVASILPRRLIWLNLFSAPGTQLYEISPRNYRTIRPFHESTRQRARGTDQTTTLIWNSFQNGNYKRRASTENIARRTRAILSKIFRKRLDRGWGNSLRRLGYY